MEFSLQVMGGKLWKLSGKGNAQLLFPLWIYSPHPSHITLCSKKFSICLYKTLQATGPLTLDIAEALKSTKKSVTGSGIKSLKMETNGEG